MRKLGRRDQSSESTATPKSHSSSVSVLEIDETAEVVVAEVVVAEVVVAEVVGAEAGKVVALPEDAPEARSTVWIRRTCSSSIQTVN